MAACMHGMGDRLTAMVPKPLQGALVLARPFMPSSMCSAFHDWYQYYTTAGTGGGTERERGL